MSPPFWDFIISLPSHDTILFVCVSLSFICQEKETHIMLFATLQVYGFSDSTDFRRPYAATNSLFPKPSIMLNTGCAKIKPSVYPNP